MTENLGRGVCLAAGMPECSVLSLPEPATMWHLSYAQEIERIGATIESAHRVM